MVPRERSVQHKGTKLACKTRGAPHFQPSTDCDCEELAVWAKSGVRYGPAKIKTVYNNAAREIDSNCVPVNVNCNKQTAVWGKRKSSYV